MKNKILSSDRCLLLMFFLVALSIFSFYFFYNKSKKTVLVNGAKDELKIKLSNGWNLISVPEKMQGMTIEGTWEIPEVWYYDNEENNYYVAPKEIADKNGYPFLEKVEAGEVYWVKSIGKNDLISCNPLEESCGKIFPPKDKKLAKGFNTLGAGESETKLKIKDFLNAYGIKDVNEFGYIVLGYNNEEDEWLVYDSTRDKIEKYPELEEIYPQKGYFVYIRNKVPIKTKEYTLPIDFIEKQLKDESAVLGSFHADPTIIKDEENKKYYLNFTGWKYPLMSSTNMVDWKFEKNSKGTIKSLLYNENGTNINPNSNPETYPIDQYNNKYNYIWPGAIQKIGEKYVHTFSAFNIGQNYPPFEKKEFYPLTQNYPNTSFVSTFDSFEDFEIPSKNFKNNIQKITGSVHTTDSNKTEYDLDYNSDYMNNLYIDVSYFQDEKKDIWLYHGTTSNRSNTDKHTRSQEMAMVKVDSNDHTKTIGKPYLIKDPTENEGYLNGNKNMPMCVFGVGAIKNSFGCNSTPYYNNPTGTFNGSTSNIISWKHPQTPDSSSEEIMISKSYLEKFDQVNIDIDPTGNFDWPNYTIVENIQDKVYPKITNDSYWRLCGTNDSWASADCTSPQKIENNQLEPDKSFLEKFDQVNIDIDPTGNFILDDYSWIENVENKIYSSNYVETSIPNENYWRLCGTNDNWTTADCAGINKIQDTDDIFSYNCIDIKKSDGTMICQALKCGSMDSISMTEIKSRANARTDCSPINPEEEYQYSIWSACNPYIVNNKSYGSCIAEGGEIFKHNNHYYAFYSGNTFDSNAYSVYYKMTAKGDPIECLADNTSEPRYSKRPTSCGPLKEGLAYDGYNNGSLSGYTYGHGQILKLNNKLYYLLTVIPKGIQGDPIKDRSIWMVEQKFNNDGTPKTRLPQKSETVTFEIEV